MRKSNSFRQWFSRCLIVLAMITTVSILLPAGDMTSKGLERFKQLAGRWEGTNSQGATVNQSFEVVSNGSAVLERLKMGDHPEMITLYHRDGDRLVLTHYCIAGNQPRMEARKIESATIDFEFVGASNLASADAGHMYSAQFQFTSPDQFQAAWTWRENGQDRHTEVIKVKRVE